MAGRLESSIEVMAWTPEERLPADYFALRHISLGVEGSPNNNTLLEKVAGEKGRKCVKEVVNFAPLPRSSIEWRGIIATRGLQVALVQPHF